MSEGVVTSASVGITGYTTDPPFYPGAGFGGAMGFYVVQQTGRYSVSVTFNYATTASVGVSIGDANPEFILRRLLPINEDLLFANLPVLNLSILGVINVRAILGSGTVTMAGDLQLNSGDLLALSYNADGINIEIDLGAPDGNIVWSMTKID